jgi:hypothetical protein
MAIPAVAIYATHPGNANSRSERQLLRSAINYLSDDLMAGNEFRLNRRQISFRDVQVRTAHAACNNAK